MTNITDLEPCTKYILYIYVNMYKKILYLARLSKGLPHHSELDSNNVTVIQTVLMSLWSKQYTIIGKYIGESNSSSKLGTCTNKLGSRCLQHPITCLTLLVWSDSLTPWYRATQICIQPDLQGSSANSWTVSSPQIRSTLPFSSNHSLYSQSRHMCSHYPL